LQRLQQLRKPKFKQFATITEQVWFSGAHADIGGSYIPEEQRDKEYPQALDDIPLDWMFKRLCHHFPHFPIDKKHWTTINKKWALAPQHEPRRSFYKIYPSALRSVANCTVTGLSWWQREVCRDRHADPIAEMIHISVLERLGATVETNGHLGTYTPANLMSVLSTIGGTYGIGIRSHSPDIRVVDWDGRELDPGQSRDIERVRILVNEARTRLS
jgi:hypothetical protein